MHSFDATLMTFMRSIVAGDTDGVNAQLRRVPLLAAATIDVGATRKSARPWYLKEIEHYVYGGDSALHVAAAAYDLPMVRLLLAAGADPTYRNRRGASALHYASDGLPTSPRWNPKAQAQTIARLIAAGADPNVADNNSATPLHRAVRTRSTGAVAALLKAGADPTHRNVKGTTPLKLAKINSGRGGSGEPEAKAEQQEIQILLGLRDKKKKKPQKKAKKPRAAR
jgi:hypothetical protein